mgnify:CR=1 FL=1
MDVFLVTQVTITPQVVLLCREAHQTVFVNVQAEWIDRSQSNVESQVKLVPVDQQRRADVFTDDHLSAVWNLTDLLRDKYALALRACCWLADPLLLGRGRLLAHCLL